MNEEILWSFFIKDIKKFLWRFTRKHVYSTYEEFHRVWVDVGVSRIYTEIRRMRRLTPGRRSDDGSLPEPNVDSESGEEGHTNGRRRAGGGGGARGARRGGRGARGGGGGARGGRARRHLRACPCPRIAQWGRAFRPKWPGPDNNYEEFKVKPRVSFLCSLLMQAVKVVMVDPSSTYEESVLALFIMNALFKQELYSTWTGTVTVTPADLPGLQRLAAGAADRPDVREQFYALLLRAPYRFLTIDPGLKRLERISRDPTASEDDVSKAKKQCRLLLGVMTLRDNRHKTLKRFEEGCDSYLATLFDLDTRSESAMSIVGDEPASVSGDDNDNSQPEPGPSGMARVEPGPSGQLSSVQMIKKRAMESPVKPVRAYVSIHDRKRKQSPLSDSSSPPSSLEDDDDD